MEGDDNSLFVFWVEGSLYISANISEHYEYYCILSQKQKTNKQKENTLKLASAIRKCMDLKSPEGGWASGRCDLVTQWLLKT